MMINRKLQFICISYIIVWLIAPPLSYGDIWRVLAAVAAVFWTLLQFSERGVPQEYASTNIRKYIVSVVLYLGIVILFDVLFLGKNLWTTVYDDNIHYFVMFFVGIVAGYYVRDDRYDELKKLCTLVILISCVFSLTSTFNPDYSGYTRYAGEYGTLQEEMLAMQAASHGVGSFGFFCLTSVLSVITLWFYYVSKNKKEKVLYMISFIILEVGVVNAGFALALLISFFGIMLCVYNNINSSAGKIIVIVLMLLMLVFGRIFINALYVLLSSVSVGGEYENKVQDIFTFILTGESTGSFQLRAERYLKSLNSIVQYPVFGSIILTGKKIIGGHSSFLDTLAAYGIIPCFSWLYSTVTFPKKMIFPTQGLKAYSKVISLLLLLTGCFNSYVMTMGVLYIVVPVMNYYQVMEENT